MLKRSELRSKNLRRPKKSPAQRKRRRAVQARRLVSLGVDEKKVAEMTPLEVRTLLKRPTRIPDELTS